MILQFFPEQIEKETKNFWNHFHFHPTDAIEDDWGKRILDRAAADGVGKTVRMYAMLEDIVSRKEDGSFCYDYTLNDQRIDYMLSKGWNLLLSYNFIPPCISREPEEVNNVSKNKTRYKGKMIVIAPPKDYADWEEICYQYTCHIVERYGLERVQNWYLQCYNEPDIKSFFMRDAADAMERLGEYVKLYAAFSRGLRRAAKGLKIGGPTLAHHTDFLDGFLSYVRENALGLDYICVHTYGTGITSINNGTKDISVKNHLPYLAEVCEIAKKNGFGSLPIVVDEWGASSRGFSNVEECPRLMFRESEIFSAYFFRMIDAVSQSGIPIDKMFICLSGQHEMKVDFSGFRGFFTLHSFPKPIYNAYVLAAKLGTSLIAYKKEEENENLSVFPTRLPNGKLAIALSYASEHFDTALPPLSLSLSGLEGRQGKIWRIDADHANAYAAFLRLGSPENLSEEQMAQIQKEAALVSEPFCAKEALVLPSNGVILLELD